MHDQPVRRLILTMASIIVAAALGQSPGLAANSSQDSIDFEILAIDGNFQAWSNVDGVWIPLTKGRHLDPETLIQSAGRGSLRLKRLQRFGSSGKHEAGEVNISSDNGIMVRLNANIIRDVITTSTYADTFKKLAGDQKTNTPKGASLASAWQRTNALFLAHNAGGAGLKKAAGSDKEGQAGAINHTLPVNMIFPRNGSILVTDQLPAIVAVRWDGLAKQTFDVFLSDGGSSATTLLGTSTKNFLIAPIYQAGSHTLRVSTRDGSHEAPPINVYVLVTTSTADKEPGGKSSRSAKPSH